MKTLVTLFLSALCASLCAQNFTKITSPNNPIATDLPTMGYAGASWVDYDKDGDLDLFVNQDFLYRNEGDGQFARILDSGIEGVSIEYNNGNSWADYDNDGDVDLMLVNRNKNGLFANNGDGTFSRVTTGAIATNINAWSPAWADYDNDGWLDLVATHPCGGTGPVCHTNWLFHSNGDGTFEEITDSDVTTGNAAYTSANWSDFDGDGDMDLFIGSGQINVISKDHIYVNQLMETGTANLVRRETGVLFGDLRDGQNWNLIDYDNDGDLDGFVTNWKDDVPCDFYKNNGDGTFTQLTQADLGVHITSEAGRWLANTWGDFNNDGWIDVFLGADGTGVNHLYMNNGDGTFSHAFPSFTNNNRSRGATIGDYDNDGDLDLFINASDISLKGLYRNNLNPASRNDANWAIFTLEGVISNRSAIGAKVRAKATIDGQAMWQVREISAQNSFAGHNSQRVHFGLGDAAAIDSLVIEWPNGLKETDTNLEVNQFSHYVEGMLTGIFEVGKEPLPLSAFPNPFVETLTIKLDGLFRKPGQLSVIDRSGAVVWVTRISGTETEGQIELFLPSLPEGLYFVKIENPEAVGVARLVKIVR
ncbi:MAG: VCBS repeat-containing protein [Lewinellaceae bacterium]|nr:VCBS repeat-containing protein [Phaeodactylibacter sp.]MCB9037846.1 VCBS repeat-containing protein [Lewinellaceae bacterium]